MSDKIPAPIAKRLIEGHMRDDASMAQHMVLHEAFALLTGQLHRAGVVDADRLAADLTRVLGNPEIAQLVPGIEEQAATLAGRIRGAAHRGDAPVEDSPVRS